MARRVSVLPHSKKIYDPGPVCAEFAFFCQFDIFLCTMVPSCSTDLQSDQLKLQINVLCIWFMMDW